MQLGRIHTSQRSRGILSTLKSRTGITPNILSRFGICLSLKDPSMPNPDEFDELGTEFLPNVLFGDYEKLFYALMINRLHKDGQPVSEKYLNRMMRAHLNRGVYSLISRIHHLSDIHEMIRAERKY